MVGFPLADKSAVAAINRALRGAASVHHTPVISLKFIIGQSSSITPKDGDTCHLAHFSAETGLYASEVKTGDDMRQSLSQGLALFHGIMTCLPSPDAYGLSAPI